VAAVGAGFGGGQGLASDPRRELFDGRPQPTRKVVLPETRLHGLVDDAGCSDVGNGAFQRLGDLDAHLAVVLGDDDEDAVAHLAPANLPGVADAVGEGGDVLGGGGGHHQHDDLRAPCALQCAEL
jgi:hypothetical protein